MKKTIIFLILATASAISAYAQTRIDVQAPQTVEQGKMFNVIFIIEGNNPISDFNGIIQMELRL